MKKVFALAIITLLALVGCSSDLGTTGINGSNGKDGDAGLQGEAGPEGPPGPAGDAGAPGEAGAKGDPGLNGGIDGKDGVPGADGTDNKIVKVWSCNFARDISVYSASGQTSPFIGNIKFWFHAAETVVGDVFVRAGVDTTNHYSKTVESESSTEFWASFSAQAANASVFLGLDLIYGANVSSSNKLGTWEFSLNKLTKVITITHTDTDMQNEVLIVSSLCE